MSQELVVDAFDLFFNKLLYYTQPQNSDFDDDDLVDGLTDLIDISQITYNQNPDLVEFIPLLTSNVTGKFYKKIATAADYLSTTAGVNREKVIRMSTTRSTDGTTGVSRLCEGISLYDYVNYVGSGHQCQVIFDYNVGSGSSPGNAAKRVRFKDLTIHFGAGITAHDRVLGKFKFDNCKMFFYRGVTFNDGAELNNCTILANTGISVSMTGGVLKNPIANKNITVDDDTQQIGIGDFNYVETLPADPTTGMV